jgi:hypothetical protein
MHLDRRACDMLCSIGDEEQHMAAQPIYPDELRLELDRLFPRITAYMDGQRDAITTQMRLDKHDAIEREKALVRRIEAVEANQQSLASAILALTQQVSALKTQTEDVLQVVRDLHAEAMEAINDLRRQNGAE